MEPEKNDQKLEETEEMTILDVGIGGDDGPDFICCGVNYIPLRW